jgi:predicted HicB family RNase H-like nuclease
MKAKRGRPPKPADERAEEVFQLRLTSADKTAWRSAADESGMSLAAWIRDRLNRAAKRDTR